MPKTVLFEQSEWTRILYAVNPDGTVPSAGPAAEVAAFAERSLAPSRAFDPIKLDEGGLMSAEQFAVLSGWADEMASRAQDVHGRGIINLSTEQKSTLREFGVIAALEKAGGVDFKPDFEALLMYYRDAGRLPLHVDDQAEYRFNTLVNVRRVRPQSGTGTGTVFWVDRGPCSIDLDPGEAVLFDAHYTPHGRLPLSEGDEIVLLSLGFTPV
jgi:hypothetical protein